MKYIFIIAALMLGGCSAYEVGSGVSSMPPLWNLGALYPLRLSERPLERRTSCLRMIQTLNREWTSYGP